MDDARIQGTSVGQHRFKINLYAVYVDCLIKTEVLLEKLFYSNRTISPLITGWL